MIPRLELYRRALRDLKDLHERAVRLGYHGNLVSSYIYPAIEYLELLGGFHHPSPPPPPPGCVRIFGHETTIPEFRNERNRND